MNDKSEAVAFFQKVAGLWLGKSAPKTAPVNCTLPPPPWLMDHLTAYRVPGYAIAMYRKDGDLQEAFNGVAAALPDGFGLKDVEWSFIPPVVDGPDPMCRDGYVGAKLSEKARAAYDEVAATQH